MREEEPFTYRARREGGVDPAMRVIALSAAGLSVLVILVALIYGGARAGGFGPPPTIYPPATPLRTAPADPGGLVVPEANVPIMSSVAPGPPPTLAPAPPPPAIGQLDQAARSGAGEAAPAGPQSP
jgi:hypothetical protein